MMFPWFLLVLRLKHGGLWKKAAVGKWEGYRGISIPPGWRKMHSTQSWGSCKDECWLFSEMLLSHCSPTVWGTCSPRWDEHCLLLGWLGPRGDDPPWTRCSLWSPGAEDVAGGPLGWVLYPQQTGPSWPWRSPGSPQVRACSKQGHLQQLLLPEHRWRHSKSRRLFLVGHLGLQLPVPAGMSHIPLLPAPGTGAVLRRTRSNPRCQHQGALCPAPGKDRLQQHNSRPSFI